MATILSQIEEVTALSAFIDTQTLPYAHLAPRHATLALYALETASHAVDTAATSDVEPPRSLVLLRKIANTLEPTTSCLAARNDDALVELLIEAGDAKDAQIAFQTACNVGFTEIVRLLLESVNPAANSNEALHTAIRNGFTEIVRMLLDLPLERGVNPAANDNAALIGAAKSGRTEIVRMLLDLPLERGVNPAARDNRAICCACKHGHTEIVRLLLDLPLERGVNPAANNNAALLCAIDSESEEVVRVLIESQAVRQQLTSCGLNVGEIYDSEIFRLLLDFMNANQAITVGIQKYASIENIRLLVKLPPERGIIVQDALMAAISHNRVVIVRILLESDHAINAQDALMAAISQNRVGIVRILLESKREIDVENAQQFAIKLNRSEILRLLR